MSSIIWIVHEGVIKVTVLGRRLYFKHLCFIFTPAVHPALCRVKIKQKGGNSSVVGGKELLKEGEVVGKHEDKVEIKQNPKSLNVDRP